MWWPNPDSAILAVDLEMYGQSLEEQPLCFGLAGTAVEAPTLQLIRKPVCACCPDGDAKLRRVGGVTAADVAAALEFRDYAPVLLSALKTADVVLFHNKGGDLANIRRAFARVGVDFDPDRDIKHVVCTWQMYRESSGKLIPGNAKLDTCLDKLNLPPIPHRHNGHKGARTLHNPLHDAVGAYQLFVTLCNRHDGYVHGQFRRLFRRVSPFFAPEWLVDAYHDPVAMPSRKRKAESEPEPPRPAGVPTLRAFLDGSGGVVVADPGGVIKLSAFQEAYRSVGGKVTKLGMIQHGVTLRREHVCKRCDRVASIANCGDHYDSRQRKALWMVYGFRLVKRETETLAWDEPLLETGRIATPPPDFLSEFARIDSPERRPDSAELPALVFEW
jgi:DNA polymerase III epsilon subunit-like protein